MAVILLVASVCSLGSRSATIAVVGASGNIGSMLVSHLLQEGHNVSGFDPYGPLENSLHIVMKSSWNLTKHELKGFEFVVFLGGCTALGHCTYNDRVLSSP
ncbi:MAG: NAD-dependent epimerase/dehydratase family protein [Limisphaerales bacterium]